jgi:methyl-accepting chemotaxis protein
MDQVTQMNAAMLSKATDAASRLRNAAADMSALISEFRVGGDNHQGNAGVAYQASRALGSHAAIIPLRSAGR